MDDAIGPNTNAPREIIRPDCLLLVGEDPSLSEPCLSAAFGSPACEHRFRGYLFQQRAAVTTIFSGMGTACVEPLIWELRGIADLARLIVIGTAGLMPGRSKSAGVAHVITSARACGSALDSVGLTGAFGPRWPRLDGLATATAVSSDFYYGFSSRCGRGEYPLAAGRLQMLFESATEDFVDMEVASFYALCQAMLPATVQYLAIKSPVNPAGIGQDHLANTPAAMFCCAWLAHELLTR